MTEYVNVSWEDVANRWETAWEESEAELARVKEAVKTIYHHGNVAWSKDRPDLTEAYNICGELIEKAMKGEDNE